jgi:hypothetical protein
MNVFWNVVNAGIATFGLIGAYGGDLGLSVQNTVLEYEKFTRTLLINAGLDVGYIGAGFFLRHRSGKSAKFGDRLHGYGTALVLQGAFLFVFDVALAIFNQVSLGRFTEAQRL